MTGTTAKKIENVLNNISLTPELIKAFKEEDTLETLYKNGINLNPTEALVLVDIIKNTNITFMSDKVDDLREKWNVISKDV